MPYDPFVDVGDLPSLGPLRYLDVRDQVAFDAGHAPGAVRLPLDDWDAAAKAADTGFAKTAYWDHALTVLAVDPTVTAVAYDSGGMTNAARVWFILQYYGLNAVILNGGWPVLVLVPGDRRADSEKVARAAGSPFARIAGTDEVRDATGFEPGAVAPFPLRRVSSVFIERTLLGQPVLWIGAGSDRHMAALSPTELLRLSRARPMDAVDEAAYHLT